MPASAAWLAGWRVDDVHDPHPGQRQALARIASDIGGTFTDTAVFDEPTGVLRLGKTLTTPGRLIDGIAAGVQEAGSAFEQAGLFLHGSTVAINALLERKGARTALLTTRGFRDVYEIGRINRPDAYNLFFRKHVPLVPRSLRFEVDERMDAAGQVVVPLDVQGLGTVARRLTEEGIESLAILFLHGYRNPAHEIEARRWFEQRLPHLFVTTSHELSQEYREFERTSTVAANAWVGPIVSDYLGGIEQHLVERGFPGRFLIVQSTGGLFDSAKARRECVRMLESGPAAGVIGTRSLCEAVGLRRAIAFDMGGTTAKAGVVIDGRALTSNSVMVGGYAEGLPIQIPMLDIQEVGTGGGSIARIVDGMGLRVGPESAGADPGPACYGRGGTDPTVTDANLLLGRLAPDRFLGGDMRLDIEAARRAMDERIARPTGLSLQAAAEGIVRIAVAQMAHVVKRVTTERGLDARDFAMVAYGGAGPLHAVAVARELAIGRVIIPQAPGHFSSLGMLMADLRRDAVRTTFVRLAYLDFETTAAAFDEMIRDAMAEIAPCLPSGGQLLIEHGADMRYVGQEHAVTVDLAADHFARHDRAGIKTAFDAAHEARYGYASADEAAEIVSLRCSVTGTMPKPSWAQHEPDPAADISVAATGHRDVGFEGSHPTPTPTFARDRLRPGHRLVGPALIEEHATTTVVPPGASLEVDRFGHLVIEVNPT
jgi:N-methylhydantoinase A